MKSLLGPVLLATIAAYFWGFLFWGGSLPYGVWEQAKDDVAAGEALLQHFPERGTYVVPSRVHDEATAAELYDDGPVAFIQMTAPDGRPMMDPTIMGYGLLHTFVVALLLALLLRRVAPALPTYGARVGFLAFVGAFAAFSIHIGDAVWWVTPLDWKLVQSVYDVVVVLIHALVLARFIPGSGTPA